MTSDVKLMSCDPCGQWTHCQKAKSQYQKTLMDFASDAWTANSDDRK